MDVEAGVGEHLSVRARSKRKWVTILSGPPALIVTRQAELEASGFETFVPNLNLRFIDPTITGGDIFSLDLQVISDRARDALELFEASAALVASPSLPAEITDAADDEPVALVEARTIGRRIAFASMCLFTVPMAWYWAPQYFALVKDAGRRPSSYGFVVVLLIAASCIFVLGLARVFFELSR